MKSEIFWGESLLIAQKHSGKSLSRWIGEAVPLLAFPTMLHTRRISCTTPQSYARIHWTRSMQYQLIFSYNPVLFERYSFYFSTAEHKKQKINWVEVYNKGTEEPRERGFLLPFDCCLAVYWQSQAFQVNCVKKEYFWQGITRTSCGFCPRGALFIS